MALIVAHKAFHSVVHSAKSFHGPLAEALSVDKAIFGDPGSTTRINRTVMHAFLHYMSASCLQGSCLNHYSYLFLSIASSKKKGEQALFPFEPTRHVEWWAAFTAFLDPLH